MTAYEIIERMKEFQLIVTALLCLLTLVSAGLGIVYIVGIIRGTHDQR